MTPNELLTAYDRRRACLEIFPWVEVTRWPTGAGGPPPLFVARCGPEVDAGLGRVAVDLFELLVAEVEVVEGSDVRFELLDAARTGKRGRHARVAHGPGKRQLGKALPPSARDLVQCADLGYGFLRDQVWRERRGPAGPATGRDPVQVLVAQHPLSER